MAIDRLIVYCRPGFEVECAAEIAANAARFDIAGEALSAAESKAQSGTGYVVFRPIGAAATQTLRKRMQFDRLVFARQLLFSSALLADLPRDDRITALLDGAAQLAPRFGAMLLETPDSDSAKTLSALCNALAEPMAAAVRERGLLGEGARLPRLHFFFVAGDAAYCCLSDPGNSSSWPMGIARLRLPPGAPSRSAHKLAEAFATFLTPAQQQHWVRPDMRAVDLGAAPGGWSWHLIHRGLRVIAIDNGPLKGDVVDNAMVKHLRVDGFRYRSPRPVDWLTCDMAAPPARIAALVAEWVATRWAQHAIFNLKLPMKKRYGELQRCEEIITERLRTAGIRFLLRFRQLYHDRDEVTGFLTAAPSLIREKSDR